MKKVWLNIWFLIAITILVSVGVFMYLFTRGIIKENKDISVLTAEFELLEDLRIQVRTSIIYHRDFLLTGDSMYLQQFRQSQVAANGTITKLRNFPGENITQSSLDSVQAYLTHNNRLLDTLLILEANQHIDSLDNEIELHSMLIFQELASLNSQIVNRLENRFVTFRYHVTQRARFSEYLIISVYLISLLLLLVSFFQLRRQIAIRLETEERLRESNLMKDKFFSIVAHDLRSPFNVLINISNLLSEAQQQKETSLMEELTREVKNVSLRTFNLLNNLLEWANSQTGVLRMNPVKINVTEITEEIIDLFEGRINEKSLKVEMEGPELIVFADKQMIHTVVRNLVGNASKFTPPGGHIHITLKESEKFIEFSIRDNGPGLSHDELRKLFRIDIDSRNVSASGEKGSGLGLILCKEFIEKHNGKIFAETNPDGGCTFSFTMPKNL